MGGRVLEHEAKTIWREAWAGGKAEKQNEMVKNLKDLGVAAELIAEAAGLTVAEVEAL